MPATQPPAIPANVLHTIGAVINGLTEPTHPVDIYAEVNHLVGNADTMDEHGEAVEQWIAHLLTCGIADEAKRLIEQDEAERGTYAARTFSELHDEVDANEYLSEAFALCHVWDHHPADPHVLALTNAATDRVDAWLRKRHGRRWLTDAELTSVLAEYARIVEAEGTLQAVRDDDLGEVHFEIVETAEDMGHEPTEDDADALIALVDAWRATINPPTMGSPA